MAPRKIYPPPKSTQKPDGLDAPLDEHYLSLAAQQAGKQSYHHAIDNAEAQEALDDLLGATRLHLYNVKKRLISHGDVVLKRWAKYSHERRAAVLRTAWDVESDQWQRVEACKRDAASDPWDSKAGSIGPIKWLNSRKIPELSKDKMRLISLLHGRTASEPQQWAAFDTQSAQSVFGNVQAELELPYNASAVIMHGEAYGTVKTFDSEAVHTWAEAGFPRAYLTFKSQYEIARWLDEVVGMLVTDAEPSENSKWADMIAGGLHSSYEEGGWSPYHLQEFAPPSAFDLKDIARKARDHLNMLVDEMELMQTSVEHMRQCVLEMKANTCFNYDGTHSAAEEWEYIATAGSELWLSVNTCKRRWRSPDRF
jgi:hypothetical protein